MALLPNLHAPLDTPLGRQAINIAAMACGKTSMFLRHLAAVASVFWWLAGCAAPPTQPTQPTQPDASGAARRVELSVENVPAENGKTLNATFVETERSEDHSMVKVEVRSGGSVSSSMFVLRGSCAVMRARGENYLSSEAMPGPGRTFRLTFPKSATADQLRGKDKSVFSAEECRLLGF